MNSSNTATERYRVAVLAPHPIQYQAPMFRSIAKCPQIELEVFYLSRKGLDQYFDPGFGMPIAWDIPLLSGYQSCFLADQAEKPPLRQAPRMNRQIRSKIMSGGFDAIWLHGWNSLENWMSCGLAIAARMPILLRAESNGLQEPSGGKRIVKKALLSFLFRHVSGFLAIGSNNAKFYQSHGVAGEKIHLTPYCVDNASFLKESELLRPRRRELRLSEGIDPELPVILFCGKFNEQKRPLDLIRAFEKMSESAQASLALVGDGALREELQAYVTSRNLQRVHFLGFRNQSQLPACYALADGFVLPSGFEPWGLVLNEAMCFGLPVIVSDQVGSAADLVRESENGFIFEAGNIESLAGFLRRMVQNSEERARMGARSEDIIRSWSFAESTQGVLSALRAARRS